jgi:hypothetical protein
METFGTAGWRPNYRQPGRNAVNYYIEEATDRGTQPKYDYLNDRVVNIHYYNSLPVAIDLENLNLSFPELSFQFRDRQKTLFR